MKILTTRSVFESADYYLSDYSEGDRWWWMRVDGSAADIGPFDTEAEALRYGRENGMVA